MQTEQEEFVCSECGATVLNEDKLCNECGASFEESIKKSSPPASRIFQKSIILIIIFGFFYTYYYGDITLLHWNVYNDTQSTKSYFEKKTRELEDQGFLESGSTEMITKAQNDTIKSAKKAMSVNILRIIVVLILLFGLAWFFYRQKNKRQKNVINFMAVILVLCLVFLSNKLIHRIVFEKPIFDIF